MTVQGKTKTASAPAKKVARKTTSKTQNEKKVLQDQVNALVSRNTELTTELNNLRDQAKSEIRELSQIVLAQALKLGRNGLI